MDSPSPSTSASNSPERGDATNGENLAVDEIMSIKRKRLKLLDHYNHEQEENILPLLSKADNINRKRKKSKSQNHGGNNTALRRSERIQTQTLNETMSLQSPINQTQHEPDPMAEPQHELEPPGQEPEPEPELTESDSDSGSEPEPVVQAEPQAEQEAEPQGEPVAEAGADPESEYSEYSEDSEPELEPWDGVEQDLPSISLVFRRVRPPRMHPAPRRAAEPEVPVPRWRQRRSSQEDNWYGEKQDFRVGHHWNTRLECSRDKVHRPSIAGIHPGPLGAYSVALSGAYPDDIDRGNVVIFTGAGGRELRDTNGRSRNVRNAPQVRDQSLNKANLSLIKSVNTGNPVRLIRGFKLGSSYAPASGYRYDGLYRVVSFWYTRGLSGFRIFRFKMARLRNQAPPPWETLRPVPVPGVPAPPPRNQGRHQESRQLWRLRIREDAFPGIREILRVLELNEDIQGYLEIIVDRNYVFEHDQENAGHQLGFGA